jgi:hypothetical protein
LPKLRFPIELWLFRFAVHGGLLFYLRFSLNQIIFGSSSRRLVISSSPALVASSPRRPHPYADAALRETRRGAAATGAGAAGPIYYRVAAYPLFPEKIDGKLKATLYPKVRYKAHIANLRLGMELGYKITKIHRGIKFHQERFMAPYINKLAESRRKNKNIPSLSEFYKLMMNSLFGKTCENPENYRRFKLLYDNDLGMKIMNSLNNIKDYHLIDPNHDIILLELMQCQN